MYGSQADGAGGPRIRSIIDHTLLRADATITAIDQLCTEARRHGFAAVCVNPCYVSRCAEKLTGSSVAVGTVIGFPLGASTGTTKRTAVHEAIADGATELDIVLNIGLLKSGLFRPVGEELLMLCAIAAAGGAATKIILEAPLLTQDEITTACRLAIDASADFVKTSTGFEGRIATIADVQLLKSAVGSSLGIKAAGGIRTLDDARRFMKAGATRLGTSTGVAIASEEAAEVMAGTQ